MAFQIKQIVSTSKDTIPIEKEVKVSPVNNNYKEVLAKYDGREISSTKGCIAKDLYCTKINQFTGTSETPDLFIDDYVLR